MTCPLPDWAVDDINIISRFISCSQIPSLYTCPPADALVFCGNAILPIAETVFSALETRPELTKTLVLCGGTGHSTRYLYNAIQNNKKYSHLALKIDGLPEAVVFELILSEFYPELAQRINSGSLRLLVEDKSTNCGANAIETRRVLELHSVPTPRSLIIVQDPTMSLRTLASFQHTYLDVSPPPQFFGCPTFVPMMHLDEVSSPHLMPELHSSVPDIRSSDLWDDQRFYDLLMGEIPRLRDDGNGYGPKGRGFIAHVDIPDDVEAAWTRLRTNLEFNR